MTERSPLRRVLDPTPRVASHVLDIEAWLARNRHILSAHLYGELAFIWHDGDVRAVVKYSEKVPHVADSTTETL